MLCGKRFHTASRSLWTCRAKKYSSAGLRFFLPSPSFWPSSSSLSISRWVSRGVAALLGRPLEVSLTKDSGLAGLVFVIRQRLGREVAKDDLRLQAIYAWLTAEFDNGR